ncbi:hypothetical protein BGZ92_006265, partial [Podila epicladia]
PRTSSCANLKPSDLNAVNVKAKDMYSYRVSKPSKNWPPKATRSALLGSHSTITCPSASQP